MDYFTEQDCIRAKAQKQKFLFIYFIVLAVYIAISVVLLVFYLKLPYKSPKISTVKWIHYPITGLFVVFSFLFIGIPIRRAKNYYNIGATMLFGRKDTSQGAFFKYDNSPQFKDGISFTTLIFIEWNETKKEYFERKILLFEDKPIPEFKENEIVKYTTQSNILLSYESLEDDEVSEEN
ncbi:MAG: hypothetical protein IKA99_01885 [Clostridia bacterium]|nr:hypothetical protein [Clostridia bacterium]